MNDINTAILTRLAFSAFIKLLVSPIKRTNFKIRNTRIKRNALNATKECEPTKKKDRYFGMVESKSTIP